MRWMKRPQWCSGGRLAVVVLLAAASVQNTSVAMEGRYATPAAGAALVCGAALLIRGLPWYVAPALATASTAWWGQPLLPLLLVALFDLSVVRRVRIAIGCAGCALAANVFTAPQASLWSPQQYGASLFLLLAVVGGLWLGSRRRLVAALAAEVEHLHVERELREAGARSAERARIAAEMHDVLAHHLSLIALHTGVLAATSDALPDRIVDRLGLVRTASTDALADLRVVLGALHEGDPAPGPPAPVLHDVQELVDGARTAGQHVDLRVSGSAELATSAHRLAVYRVVQEALSNARKHAQSAPVTIRLDYAASATAVEISNPLGTPSADITGPGFGLVGLRERVTALGGHLSAGPGGAGNWRLAARLPRPAASGQGGVPR